MLGLRPFFVFTSSITMTGSNSTIWLPHSSRCPKLEPAFFFQFGTFLKAEASRGIVSTKRRIDFEAPPVVETSWNVFFAPVPKWTALEAGVFWNQLRSEYPEAHLMNPVGKVELGSLVSFSSDEIELGGFPLRCKLVHRDGSQLLQIQSNSFRRSWKATEEDQRYQHYDETKPLFDDDWRSFVSFLDERQLGPATVWQCEVTYINHFEKGREWRTFEDIKNIFRWESIPAPAGTFTSAIVAFSFTRHTKNAGRIEIDCQLAARKRDGKELLQLRISSFVRPSDSSVSAIQAAMSLAHDEVIDTFVEVTSENVQRLWRRI